jgi:hypothetical protein
MMNTSTVFAGGLCPSPELWAAGRFSPDPPNFGRWADRRRQHGLPMEIGRDDRAPRVSCDFPDTLFHAARKTPVYLRAQSLSEGN